MGNTPGKALTSKNPYFQTFETITRQGKEYLICRKSTSHPRLREIWEKSVDQLRKIGNEHILTPNKWSVIDKSICGNGQIVEIEYDNFSVNLTELIEERSLGNKNFDQSQLWYVLLTLARVGVTCNSLGHRIGDIRPENILLNKQREIKILTFLSFPNDIDPFMDQNPKNFFSPEELDQLKKQYLQNMTDPVRSESFSIGLTVLSLALLHQVDHLYNRSKGELNEQLLDKYLQNLSTHTYISATNNTKVNYSKSFCDALGFLLRANPESRLSYTSLCQQIQPFIQDIQQFKPFNLKLQVPRLPIDQKSPKKQIITLKSRSSQMKTKNQSSPFVQDKKPRESPSPQLKYSPIVQSRYFKGDERVEKKIEIFEGNDLLKKIDERLKRSREEFPS